MARTHELYNHHNKPVGTATWNKRNSTVDVHFNNEIHYSDTNIPFDEFDAYIARMDLKTPEMLGQVTLEDLI